MSDIIDAIDHAIADYSISDDAMRWTADPGAAEVAEQAGVHFAYDATPILATHVDRRNGRDTDWTVWTVFDETHLFEERLNSYWPEREA